MKKNNTPNKYILFFKINIPGNIEQILKYNETQSNYESYFLHINLYHSRNIFYIFSIASGLFYYFNYYYISYYFFVYGLINNIFTFYYVRNKNNFIENGNCTRVF